MKPYLLLVVFLCGMSPVFGQSAPSGGGTPTPEPYEEEEFPEWIKSLDRGKNIAFGAFPFAYMLTGLGYDIWYYSESGGDPNFAPWPVGPGTGALSQDLQNEKYKSLLIGAALVSITIAVVDWALGQMGVDDGSLGP